MRRLRTRTIGLLASLAIILLIVVTPIALIAIGMAPWDLNFAKAGSLLSAPDDGHLAIALVAGIAWVAWAVLFFAIGTEIVSRIRGVETPRVPPLRLPQQFAGRLVAVASLLFVSAPTVAPATAAPRAHAMHPVAQVKMAEHGVPSPEQPAATSARPRERDVERNVKDLTFEHAVKPGETLWKIADQHLGDGTRWIEIFELNRSTLGEQPDFVRPGTLLLIPTVDEHAAAAETYVVRPGDTLSGIAQRALGDARRYPEIFDASRDTAQPNGGPLTHPDLIVPGWRLTIPDAKDRAAPTKDEAESADTMTERSRADRDPIPEAAAGGGEFPEDVLNHDAAPGWLVPGLAGAGALLAGALLQTLRSHRRTQLRYRSPGEVIAPPPQELRNIEKSAQASGTGTAVSLASMDRLLRHMAAVAEETGDTPQTLFAELSDEALTLHLSAVYTLPTPWHGAGTTWTAPLDADVEDVDRVSPFPLLATIGRSNDGHVWLANLEQTGPVALTGDPDNASNLARHIAAELVLNPWASLVDVDLLGLGDELAALDPLRVHIRAADDASFLSAFADDLGRRSSQGPPERPCALVCAVPADIGTVSRIAAAHTVRASAAIVVVVPSQESGLTPIVVSPDQILRTTLLDTDLVAAGLTTDEAQACAAIVDVTRTATPQSADPANEGRSSPPDGALTVSAVDSVEPMPSRDSRSGTDPDHSLDDDLAAWLDPTTSLPRLTLLGPVRARACGDARAVVKRKPYYTEVLAYLALHPGGVTPTQLADDFGITATRARVDVNAVRNWLGDNPRSGRRHVPDAQASLAARGSGVPTYQVEDLLTDVDLFRRLRQRGESRGVDGICDLVQALNLVTGQPFDQLRPGGWSWLLDGDRVDHTMTCAVVDVAHLVTTHALEVGDVNLAETAANTAHRASPYDEIAKLDLVAALAAGGHEHEAQRLLHDEVFNRRDGELGPTEMSVRTQKVVRQRRRDQA